MNRKTLKSFMVVLLLCAYTPCARAYDFSFKYSGQTLYYNLLNGQAMVTLEQDAFQSYKNLVGTVIIPDSVTYNGDTYPVTSIDGWAFYNCNKMTSITMPDGLVSIGMGAFEGCTGLTSVTFGSGLKEIGMMAFQSCSNLTDATLPDSLTSIGGSAFNACSKLTSVTIPDGVLIIEGQTFCDCHGLTSVTLGSGIVSIKYNAFMFDSSLTEIIFPDNLKEIGDNAFNTCNKLTSIVSNNVTSIGNGAFQNCTGLTSVVLNDSLSSIGNSAFANCVELTSVKFNATTCSTAGTFDLPVFENCSKISSFVFGENVKIVPDQLLKGLTGVDTLAIPDEVTVIGNYAFYMCEGLKVVSIGKGVSSIGFWAFFSCRDLESVIFNAVACDSVAHEEGYSIFRGSTKIYYVTFGEEVTVLPSYLFLNQASIVSMYMLCDVPPIVQDDALTGVSSTVDLYVNCNAMSAYQNNTAWNQFNIVAEFPYSFSAVSEDEEMGTVEVLHHPDCGDQQAVVQAIPIDGHHFVEWSDGDTNTHRMLQVDQDTFLIAKFAVDGEPEGIEDVILEGEKLKVMIANGHIYVTFVERPVEFKLYDVSGRCHASAVGYCRISTLPAGVYLVKVEALPPYKFVLTK